MYVQLYECPVQVQEQQFTYSFRFPEYKGQVAPIHENAQQEEMSSSGFYMSVVAQVRSYFYR